MRILRHYVTQGRGFHQSYLFAGPYGSGKTTLGRIMARALLCEAPQEGEPCNACMSCRSILERGSADCYLEIDAATNSGKDDVTRITEGAEYDTFSGKKRIYLFDEAHQLSRDALDALLKPLEENSPGSQDKKLVCIFCTTEPEKMRNTILSRCAPAFVIQPLDPAIIADRLAKVCEAEGFSYELDSLRLIAEMTECHIRDCLKAVEGVSMLGKIDQTNVAAYLHLDLNTLYLDVLDLIGKDVAGALQAVETLTQRASPLVIYQRLADAAMTAYKLHLGAQKPATFWDMGRLAQLAEKGEELLGFAARFASRPARPTTAMLLCDVAQLHHVGWRNLQEGVPVVVVQQSAAMVATGTQVLPHVEKLGDFGKVETGAGGDELVKTDLRAVNKGTIAGTKSTNDPLSRGIFSPEQFVIHLGNQLAVLHEKGLDGRQRRFDMDRSGTDEPGRAEG